MPSACNYKSTAGMQIAEYERGLCFAPRTVSEGSILQIRRAVSAPGPLVQSKLSVIEVEEVMALPVESVNVTFMGIV